MKRVTRPDGSVVEIAEDGEVLKNGQFIRVPIMLMDGQSPSLDELTDRAMQARDARISQICTAWKHAANYPYGSSTPEAAKPLTIDTSITDPRERVEALREARFRLISNAWRNR
jgi:hypothetical protein